MPLSFLTQPLLDMPRVAKRSLALAVDVALCVGTVWLAYCLRLESLVRLEGVQWWAVWGSVFLALPLFVRLGLYRAIFRYSGWNAMQGVGMAIGLYGLFYATIFAVVGVAGVPRSVGVVQPLLLFVAVGGSRVLVRYWLGGQYRVRLQGLARPGVLIYGAGSAGRQLAAALSRAQEQRVLGFLDDDARLQGQSLDGRKIHAPDQLPELIQRLGVTDILLAMPSVQRVRRNAILEALRRFPVHVRTMPGVADMAAGRVDVGDIQELEVEDLLGRDPVVPQTVLLHKHTRGQVVMVTGAGGSIGSELCRQIARCRPRTLLLVELNEYALYQIHQELEQLREPGLSLIPLLASVRDARRMDEVVRTWKPHSIYHAAAYKHVPLVEHNPAEGVRNNVWGTWVCAEAAARHGVPQFVLVSTDKAVRPTNIMGASKRLAEMVLQALATRPGTQTCFAMVRFGNVLGSSGSVVPLFRQQIKAGGPITLTHPDITRYFMTIPEASQLVIQAGAMATGGDVFVLDMGQPVRIHDLAKRMVELSGLSLRDPTHPEGDIAIEVTGLRPGEKLYEELLIGDNPQGTQHPRIMKAQEPCLDWPVLEAHLRSLETVLDRNDVPALRDHLVALVGGYQPETEVVDWVFKANQTA